MLEVILWLEVRDTDLCFMVLVRPLGMAGFLRINWIEHDVE